MARIIFMMLGFLTSIILVAGDATGKTYYRWMDDDGVTQLSDQPPQGRTSEAVSVNNDASSENGSPVGEVKSEASDNPLPKVTAGIEKRREEVFKDLEEKVAHYSNDGGITEGKLAALKEAAEIVKKAKMDGGEADDVFYDKIAELVRAIKDRDQIIGRVHRLLNEAKVMKGFAAPLNTEESQ